MHTTNTDICCHTWILQPKRQLVCNHAWGQYSSSYLSDCVFYFEVTQTTSLVWPATAIRTIHQYSLIPRPHNHSKLTEILDNGNTHLNGMRTASSSTDVHLSSPPLCLPKNKQTNYTVSGKRERSCLTSHLNDQATSFLDFFLKTIVKGK